MLFFWDLLLHWVQYVKKRKSSHFNITFRYSAFTHWLRLLHSSSEFFFTGIEFEKSPKNWTRGHSDLLPPFLDIFPLAGITGIDECVALRDAPDLSTEVEPHPHSLVTFYLGVPPSIKHLNRNYQLFSLPLTPQYQHSTACDIQKAPDLGWSWTSKVREMFIRVI